MNKFQVLKLLKSNGDSTITFKTEEPIVVTTDFKNDHINKTKRNRRYVMKKGPEMLLIFSWTDNKFRNIKVSDIKKIEPLSSVLKNKAPEL